MKASDIIVVGSGVAGLVSAIISAKSGLKVSVLSGGSGVISIAGGGIDLLGYINEKLIKDSPLNHISSLPKTHPYNILGAKFIDDSLKEFINIANEGGLNLSYNDNKLNKTTLTIIGTLKPTYISSDVTDVGKLFNAKKVAVISVDFFKDCKVKLIINGLKAYKNLADKEYSEVIFSSPFGKTYRSLNALDIARFLDTKNGVIWLKDELDKIKSSGYDIAILPPILGVINHNEIVEMLKTYPYEIVEMNSVPPAVGGFRLREALFKVAVNLGVTFVENCLISNAIVDDKRCLKLLATDNNVAENTRSEFAAKTFIIATGGILGGGVKVGIDNVYEKIFKLNIDCPKVVEERSVSNVFGDHIFSSIGVKVNERMIPVDSNNNTLFSNVFFAGKILGGYDFAKEKSGYGVAITSARKAAIEAVYFAKNIFQEGR